MARTMEERLTRIEVLLEEVKSKLDQQRDYPVRLDRLEQAHARLSKLFWVVAPVALGALAKAFLG